MRSYSLTKEEWRMPAAEVGRPMRRAVSLPRLVERTFHVDALAPIGRRLPLPNWRAAVDGDRAVELRATGKALHHLLNGNLRLARFPGALLHHRRLGKDRLEAFPSQRLVADLHEGQIFGGLDQRQHVPLEDSGRHADARRLGVGLQRSLGDDIRLLPSSIGERYEAG